MNHFRLEFLIYYHKISRIMMKINHFQVEFLIYNHNYDTHIISGDFNLFLILSEASGRFQNLPENEIEDIFLKTVKNYDTHTITIYWTHFFTFWELPKPTGKWIWIYPPKNSKKVMISELFLLILVHFFTFWEFRQLAKSSGSYPEIRIYSPKNTKRIMITCYYYRF